MTCSRALPGSQRLPPARQCAWRAQLRALILCTYLDVHIAACQGAVHMSEARQNGRALMRCRRAGPGRTTSSEHACTARLCSAGEGQDSVRSAAQPTASMLRRRRQCRGARRPSMMQPLTFRLSRWGMRSSALSRPVTRTQVQHYAQRCSHMSLLRTPHSGSPACHCSCRSPQGLAATQHAGPSLHCGGAWLAVRAVLGWCHTQTSPIPVSTPAMYTYFYQVLAVPSHHSFSSSSSTRVPT